MKYYTLCVKFTTTEILEAAVCMFSATLCLWSKGYNHEEQLL